MANYIVIALGAALGANLRYVISTWAAGRFGAAFPYGTLIINVSGSFVIGLFLTLIAGRFTTAPSLRLFFAIGFLGAYTTFSTFSFETLALLQTRAYVAAGLNVVVSVALGLIAVTLGAFAAQLLQRIL